MTKHAVWVRGWGLTAMAAWIAIGPVVRADTVVTKDGRRFTGEVNHVDNEYIVKTKFGEVRVNANDFDHIDKDKSPGATATPVSPVTPRTVITPATKPSIGPAAGNGPKKIDAKTLEALLKQGHDALAAGEYKAARDAFSDAVAGTEKNVEALHGLGMAYMYLNDFPHARDPMEKAMAAAGPSANRALVLNMCVCQIGLKNPMRGAKAVMDHLNAHANELDEPMLNAMGTALNVADAQAKKAALFHQCVTFYIAYNAKVEAQNHGSKRWGVTWMRADEVDKKNASNARAEKEMAKLDKEYDTLNRQVEKEQREVDVTADLVRRGFKSDFDLTFAQDALKLSTTKRAENQKAYDVEVAKLEHPSFPRAMTLVAIDDLTPPPIGGRTAVAEAPLFPEIQAPKPAPRRASATKKPETMTPEKTGGTTNTPPPEEPPQISIAAQPKPKRNVRITTYGAAFPVSDTLLLTASASVANATEITVQTSDGTPLKASLVRADPGTGLALLRVTERKFMPLVLASGFTGGPIQCASYPTVNIFNPIAENIPGTAKAPGAGWKVALTHHPRLGGSPLLAGNKVVGVELATRDTESGSIPAATLEQVRQFLGTDAPAGSGNGPDPCASLLQLIAVRESSGE